jgi:hypothetical protein
MESKCKKICFCRNDQNGHVDDPNRSSDEEVMANGRRSATIDGLIRSKALVKAEDESVIPELKLSRQRAELMSTG